MKVSILPKSKFGKWALVSFTAEVMLLVLFFSIMNIFNVKGGDTFFSNPELAIPLIMAWLSGAIGFSFGCYTLIRDNPRSLLVFIVTLITLMTTLFGIMEIAVPH